MRLSIGETARVLGVSVRTLRYYDEIGLIKPSELSEAGYRYYDNANLVLLQQILFYRELEFSLKEIQHMLSHPAHDQKQALSKHRALLVMKQNHIADLIRLVDETLGGDNNMCQDQQINSDYEEVKKRYASEVKVRWGQTDAFAESSSNDGKRTHDESVKMMNEADEIFSAFAHAAGKSPSDPDVQQLVRVWQAHITKYHYNCTDEILLGLGEMYTADGRFTENIDRYGPGTAAFISEAIKLYCVK